MSRREELRNEARRVEESARHSAQNQFEYAKTWRRVDQWLGGTAALLAAVSGAGGLSEVISPQWAGLVALVAAGIGAVATSLGAPKAKDRAYSSANALLALQQDARIYVQVDLEELDDEEAREQLRTLVAPQQELNATAEIPSNRAWRRAKQNIEKGGQTYEVDQT